MLDGISTKVRQPFVASSLLDKVNIFPVYQDFPGVLELRILDPVCSIYHVFQNLTNQNSLRPEKSGKI